MRLDCISIKRGFNMKKLEFTAKGGRLLKQLEEAGVPYAAAQKALRSKDVLVNGQRVKSDSAW